jgi:hypothetical protein
MRTAIALAAAALLVAGAAHSQNYTASLDGSQEVPPNPSPATGSATLTLDAAKILSYNITFSGLLGTETAAHIHCCAPPGISAGVLFPLPPGNPKIGSVGPLTAQQESDLNAGLMYVNIHTNLYPGGEIRGQIYVQPTPVEPTTWGAVKAIYRTF